ncbi:MAG: sulfur carrier protein ThiS, partial [Xanthobacteraceae bacterium]
MERTNRSALSERLTLFWPKTADIAQRGVAVALNGAVVPRAAWRDTLLRTGDSVEIVRARQ